MCLSIMPTFPSEFRFYLNTYFWDSLRHITKIQKKIFKYFILNVLNTIININYLDWLIIVVII